MVLSSNGSLLPVIISSPRYGGKWVATRVYKWRDADGVWQITDEPPPEGTKFEKLEYVNDANVVPSVPKKTTKKN